MLGKVVFSVVKIKYLSIMNNTEIFDEQLCGFEISIAIQFVSSTPDIVVTWFRHRVILYNWLHDISSYHYIVISSLCHIDIAPYHHRIIFSFSNTQHCIFQNQDNVSIIHLYFKILHLLVVVPPTSPLLLITMTPSYHQQ